MIRVWRTVLGFCVIGLLGAGGEARGSFWGLPYESLPLVQQGSANLLPPIAGAPESRVWHLKGGASVASADGEPALRLAPGDEFSVTAPMAGGRLYRLEMEFQFSPDTAFVNSADSLGLNGWVEPLAPGERDRGAYLVCEVRLLPAWQHHRSYFYADNGVTGVRISLGLNAQKGAVRVRRIALCEVPVDAKDALSVVNTGKDAWAELPRESEPAAPQSVTFYPRRNPDRLFPYSAPTEQELTQPIALSGTPGEVLIAAAGLFAPSTLGNVKLSMPDLRSAGGHALRVKLEWFEIRYQPRKANYYGRGRTFRLVADSLWPRPKGAIARGGQTTAFWLRFTVPAAAAPGAYKGTLMAETSAGSYVLPVEIRVLPISLVDPPSRTWGLYADSSRWAERSDEQVMRELSDIKAHGIESLLIDVGLGTPLWRSERVVGWHMSSDIDRFLPLIKRVGVRGPIIVDWWEIENELAQHLNVSPEVLKQHADRWPAKLGTAYLDALRAFDMEWKARSWGDWVYAGIDEPGYWKPGSPEMFRFQYDAAAAAGVPSYCTSSDLPSDPIGRPLTYHCVGSTFADAPTIAEQFLREGKQHGQHIWFYASGSYDAQVGNLSPNRWITGFLFYRTGAEGSYSWTFQRPVGPDPFDDFYRTEIQPCITYPDPEHRGENLDTPHWEAIRQGWYDYRYASTLAQAIEHAKRQPAKSALAAQVEHEFRRLLDSMPWSANKASMWAETNSDYDAWRQQIAKMILRLK